jgi:hypothetical protein
MKTAKWRYCSSMCVQRFDALDTRHIHKRARCHRICKHQAYICNSSFLHYAITNLQVFIIHHGKQSFFCAINAIYGKIGRAASEEIILRLVKSICIPCLLYGIDACPINRTDGNYLGVTVRRTLFKIFHTTSQSVIPECQKHFHFTDIDLSPCNRGNASFSKNLRPLRIFCVNLFFRSRNVS